MEASNYLYSSLLLSFLIFLFYLIGNKRRTNNIVSFINAMRNNHRFLDWATDLAVSSPTATVTMFGGAILTANPSNVEHITKTNFDNYPHGPTLNATMEDLLGHGIFNSDGEQWHLQRKIAAVDFNSRTFRNFVTDTVTSQVVARLIPFLSSQAAVIDLKDTLDRFAFDNVCKMAFGFDPCLLSLHDGTSEGDAFARSFEQAIAVIVKRFARPSLFWSMTRFLDIGAEKGMKRHLAILNDFAAKIVTERRKKRDDETPGNDLLSRFMKAGDFPDEFLRDVMLNYVLAGRDTTSSAMSWFFWLVSSNSAIEENILKEIRSIRRKHGSSEAFTGDELREMSYLHAAISESMRLYPHVALEVRTSKEADILPDGTKVAKGTRVFHSPYIMGRMESTWGEDCREFKPERWLGEDGVFQPRNQYRYPVFHAGPRMCLGKDMAYIQMKAVVASVMEKFVIDVIEKGEKEQYLTFVLRMKKGLPVRIRARLAVLS